MATVLNVLIKHFKNWNVTHVFGIPGRPVVPIIKEMVEQDITFVLSRHETGAGYAAGGFALCKKTLGVAFATAGPGGTNMVTAAGQAMAHHAPVLFLTGQISGGKIGKSYSQDSSPFGADLVKMFDSVTKYSARVERGDSFENHLMHAIEKAFSGVKGPVHLSIPLDVLFEEIEPFQLDLPQTKHTIAANLEEVFTLIKEAKNPVFLLGKGVRTSNSYEEVYELATRWNIPVITTGGGKGTFPTNHPLSLGVYGLGGTQEADQYLQSGVDCMIVAGSSLNDMALAGFRPDFYPEKVIHFDYDPTFVGKSIPKPTIYVPGDLKENLKQLLGQEDRFLIPELAVGLEEKSPAASSELDRETDSLSLGHWERFLLPKQTEEEYRSEDIESKKSSPYISSASAIQVIRVNLPEYSKVFADVGSHAYFAVKHFDVYHPDTFFFDDRFIAMGNGIGYAIGAKIADSDNTEPVACITGDGCMLMHGTEIATAVEHRAPVLFFVFNNGGLDMVETGMKLWQKCPGQAVYKKPIDFVSFAKAMGCEGFHCVNKDDIEKAIQYGLHSDFPTIIEIMVDPNEIPPTLKRDE